MTCSAFDLSAPRTHHLNSGGVGPKVCQTVHRRALGRTLLVIVPVVSSAVALVAGVSANRAGASELPVPVPCRLRAAPLLDPERIPLTPAGSDRGFSGYFEIVFASSPFGVTVSRDGHSVYDVRVQLETARRRDALPTLVAWVTTPDLDQHVKLGVVDDDMRVAGRVDWNKFLVFVTAEQSADVDRWQGPILLTAMSPSGWMHTMAGHGIFESYAC